jgi:transcription-repair coupling factor (superfamily II helicase)
LIKAQPARFLIILADSENAAYFHNDLVHLLDEKMVSFFPSSYKRSVHYEITDPANITLRTEVLQKILNAGEDDSFSIVTYPEAIAEPVVTKAELSKNTYKVKNGDRLSIDFLDEVLDEFGFERVDFVYEPGQYAIRGGIVDLYSYSDEQPHRIDFFGNEIESIRSFQIDNQSSIAPVERITIVPNILQLSSKNENTSFLAYAGKQFKICADDLSRIYEKLRDMQNPQKVRNEDTPSITIDQLLKAEELMIQLADFSLIEFGQQSELEKPDVFTFKTSPQPLFHKNFDLLCSALEDNQNRGYNIFITTENEKQISRLHEIFNGINQRIQFTPWITSLHEGFSDHDLKICIYTDHQIFDRFHKYKFKESFRKDEQITIRELTALRPGDYIVHIDHGIGKFGGLHKIENDGKVQEVLRLIYRDNDILFVNIHSLHKIAKYKGKDDGEPKVYKLGTGAWQKIKQNTKKRVKDIARELIALYAKRNATQGFSFSADSYLQQELEASFIYEDTPDQITATRSVKAAMESPNPMDMLICGDVGFGKTEIAIRAAFKAVADSKQVAILVPTTILALQHYNTFSDRLKNFPCTLEYISRFKSAKQQKEILEKLENGKIDILIGTHRLLGKEIKFKDIGLLIIDEEQKFGVAAKEKLKNLKLNIDTLTLTATPIPRTLQFSLMGARDLSIINTPPPNRYPIITELNTFHEEIIEEAIEFEISRGGQVFFIHNRVQNIHEVELMINKIIPKARTVVAHGQMEGSKLEKIMLGFIQGDYDVLVSTSIIESGLDIANANTIIINNAQNFGLSDLHQLRGRVGRSNKKAFCYLITPPLVSLTPEARRRLKAIEENSDLGSGFNIAMQDLDIRGAGDLLGAEQSGFIAEIGYETYYRILNEAMLELKDEEFTDLYYGEKDEKQKSFLYEVNSEGKKKERFVTDCQIDTDLEILFPEEYVSNVSERIRLYRELDSLENMDNLQRFSAMLNDRFGKIPPQVEELMNVVKLRWLAMDLGFEKMILKDSRLLVYFVANPMSPYYKSEVFQKVLHFIQKQPSRYRMKEAKEKLNMIIDQVANVGEALKLLGAMIE